MDGTGGSTVRHDGITLEDMAKRGQWVKRPRHGTLGQTVEHNKVGLLVWIHPRVIGMDDDGTNT